MTKNKKMTKEAVQKQVAAKGFPEAGTFTERADLQTFYKHLTTEQLAEWVELEGLTFTPNESPSINRMRMCMAILYKEFPKAPAAKKKAKYADWSLEQLIDLAIEKDVAFEATDDERILRMRAIMALRVAGHIQ